MGRPGLHFLAGNLPDTAFDLSPLHVPKFTWTNEQKRQELERSGGRVPPFVAIYSAQQRPECLRVRHCGSVAGLTCYQRPSKVSGGVSLCSTGSNRIPEYLPTDSENTLGSFSRPPGLNSTDNPQNIWSSDGRNGSLAQFEEYIGR